MSILRRLLSYTKPHIGVMGLAYVFMLVLNVANVVYAALIGPALQYIFTSNVEGITRSTDGSLRPLWTLVPVSWVQALENLDAQSSLWLLPGLIVVVAVIKGVGQGGQFFLFGHISQRILLRIRSELFGALLRQPPSFFERRTHGDLLSRLTHDAQQIEQGFFYGFAAIVRDGLSVVGLLAYVLYSDAQLALIAVVTVPIAVLPLLRFANWLKSVSGRGQRAQGEIHATGYEALLGVRVVQSFCAEAREQAVMHRSGEKYYRQMLRSYLIRALRTPTMEILGAVALGGLVALLSYHVRYRSADPAHYMSFLGAVFLMYDPLKRLGQVSDHLAAAVAAGERIFEIIDRPVRIEDAPNAVHLPPFAHEVRFEMVDFAYDKGRSILHGVELDLPKGSLTALVGPSGAGKSTLANLLPRFYDVLEGSVRIDGYDVREVTLNSLRSQVAMVGQDTFLFNDTVANNIAYGRSGASLSEIRRAAEVACADGFIAQLEQGYDTMIGERGTMLSGGQRQRIAIARAILKDAPILVLDEATSNLDVESERWVHQALEALMQGRTSLVIAHRLSTVRRADCICVVVDGRIVERGSHEVLLGQGGEYARLYALQFVGEERHQGVS
ncbi:MAG: ABC transporter ATP-binding protein [Myxococcota bacterium]